MTRLIPILLPWYILSARLSGSNQAMPLHSLLTIAIALSVLTFDRGGLIFDRGQVFADMPVEIGNRTCCRRSPSRRKSRRSSTHRTLHRLKSWKGS